jgi:hypothetical protein
MKSSIQIQNEIDRIKSKLLLAKSTTKGYNVLSKLRSDETRIKTLQWVLEEDE